MNLKRAACIAGVIGVSACTQQPSSSSWWNAPAAPTSAAAVTNLVVQPRVLRSGQSSEGTLTVEPASTTATVVRLSSSDPSVSVPSEIGVPPGFNSVTFPISTSTVDRDTIAMITANLSGRSFAAPLAVFRVTANSMWYEAGRDGAFANYTSETATLTAGCTSSTITARANGALEWSINFTAPGNTGLRPGVYENVTTQASNTRATLGVIRNSSSTLCASAQQIPSGRLVVDEIEYLSTGTVRRLGASYELRCPDGALAIRGEVRLVNPAPAFNGTQFCR